jgi:hypothetical protein
VWWILAIIAAVLFIPGAGDTVTDLIATVTRGPRLTTCNYDATTGVVTDAPADLAAAMDATVDECALARMVSSEHGNDSNLIKAAVASVACNYAARAGLSISAVLLQAQNANHRGFFGAQEDVEYALANPGKHKSDRYASTRLDPHQGDLDLARGVLNGEIADPTVGATNFDVPRGESNPDAIATQRLNAGLVAYDVEGIDPAYLRFWGPA